MLERKIMGNKRLKIAKGLGDFIPISFNLTYLKGLYPDQEYDSAMESDDGLESKRMENNLEYEELVAQILSNLEMRDKLIFVFQLLRDLGYQIDHATFAKVLNMSRAKYMRILSNVKIKTRLFILGIQSQRDLETKIK